LATDCSDVEFASRAGATHTARRLHHRNTRMRDGPPLAIDYQRRHASDIRWRRTDDRNFSARPARWRCAAIDRGTLPAVRTRRAAVPYSGGVKGADFQGCRPCAGLLAPHSEAHSFDTMKADMQLSEGKIQHLRALSNKKGVIAAAAMDQRGSLRKAIASAKGVPQEQITDQMMSEFKVAVAKALTPHASAILLDPEFGIPAAKARAKNAGLLLAYEESGYDNTKPGRLPDLLPHLSVKRIKDLGADAIKILIYYTPSDSPDVNDIKHAFIERIGAECEYYQIPFCLEFVGYDPQGGDEKGFEYAKKKPDVVIGSMKEFGKPQYKVDVLKVEVPVNSNFVEGSTSYKGQSAYSRKQALDLFRKASDTAQRPFIYLSA